MKKQITTALLAFLTSTVVLAQAKPIFIGDVVQKDELLILNGNITCSAYSTAVTDGPTDPKSIVFGNFTEGVVHGNLIHASGYLDGDLFTISVNLESGSVNISLQESALKKDPKARPNYSYMSNGDFTKKYGGVDLTLTFNGRSKSVGCSKD